jgi:hypothetical protein
MQLSIRTAISAVATFALVLAAGAAQAQYLMSGTLTLVAGTSTTRVIAGGANVLGTPGSLMIPAGAFQANGGAFRVFPTVPTVAQVISAFTSSNAAATLVAGGGPSAFDFCPQNVFGCTAPNNATPAGFNGLVRYLSGSGFGGSFTTLRDVTGSVARLVAPNSYEHSDATAMSPWNPGRGFQFTQTQQAGASKVTTISPVIGPSGSIQTVGTIIPPTTPPVTITTFTTGFPLTTGMIFAQDTQGALPSKFTFTGSDNRNVNGHGSITLVAGSIANIPTDGTRAFPRFTFLTMTLAPPVPTMGAAGLAALGILILLGGGYALRHRL